MGNKKILAALFLAAGIFGITGTCSAAEAEAPEFTYSTVSEVYDWGAEVSRIVIDFGSDVSAREDLAPENFKAEVKRTYAGTDDLVQTMDYSTSEYVVSPTAEGERKITNVYASDAQGNPAEGETNYVTLEMEVGPEEGFGNVLGAETETGLGLNVVLDCAYTITFQGADGASQTITSESENSIRLLADNFEHGQVYTTETPELLDDGIENDTLHYASYAPDDNEKHPLLIWLHGLGEGGTDTYVPVMGNKVPALIDEEIQGIMGGAYVLVPQTPTKWMDVDAEGNMPGEHGATSIYTKTLMELIESYVAANPNIDTNRIYIGGCSNGGYMTVNMLIQYPDYFTAAYPICEAYPDELITDEQIQDLASVPIWFTHAATDPLVVPDKYTVPTYDRLVEAGAENLHFTHWTNVHDTTGLYQNEEGQPYEYFGHASWNYTFNNECTMDNDYSEGKTADEKGSGQTIFEWLAEQSK